MHSACPQCGSLAIGMATVRDGLAVGAEMQVSVCPDCGYRGLPISFETEAEWRDFNARFGKAPADAADTVGPAASTDPTGSAGPAWNEPSIDIDREPQRHPSRGTAVFIAVLGVPMVAFGVFSAIAFAGAVAQVSAGGLLFSAGGMVMGLVGLAFLRIAARLWRSTT